MLTQILQTFNTSSIIENLNKILSVVMENLENRQTDEHSFTNYLYLYLDKKKV